MILFAVALTIQSCSTRYYLSEIKKQQQYPIDKSISADTAIQAFYQPYKHQLDSIMDDIVAVSEEALQKRQPEGTLNNFFADAVAEASKDKGIDFDMVYSNYGGLRISLPQGNIPRAKIFELMPFENAIVTVKFSGKDIQHFFDFMAEEGGAAISGARFKIDKARNKAIDITINGQPIDLQKDYIILTSDYMANGGDAGKVFFRAKSVTEHNYKLRDAVLDYLEKLKKSGKTLKPVQDGRIAIK